MIENNFLRIGNFTSSGIYALIKFARDKKSFGGAAITYIMEKRFERMLGRSINLQVDSRPLLWGKANESFAFSQLGLEYKLCSQETMQHPTIDFWCGSPDGFNGADCIIDLKCPMTPLSFMRAYVSENIEQFRELHQDGDKYFWQIVSNAILTGVKYGEIIFFCPYFSQLEKVKQLSVDIEFTKMKNEYAWIFHAPENELPYIPDGCGVKNIKIIRWEISQEDKDFLTERVECAGELLKMEEWGC